MKKRVKNDIQLLPDSVPTVDSGKTFLGTVIFLILSIMIYSAFIRKPESYAAFYSFNILDILAMIIAIEIGILMLNLILRISRKKRRYQSFKRKKGGRGAV